MQSGNSEITFKDYPLFKSGDRMLLFLRKAVDTNFENSYWIIGEYTTIMDIQFFNDTTYALDRLVYYLRNCLEKLTMIFILILTITIKI